MQIILNFILQMGLSFFLFFGFMGIGFLILKVFSFDQNIFLKSGLAFFFSLCLYVLLGAVLLFIIPNKKGVIIYFSFLYFFISFFILFLEFKKVKFKDFGNKIFCNKGLIFLCFFIVAIIFLCAYNTSLLDEWLHRPVLNFFKKNNQFPFKSPYSPESNFIANYHYGLYILGIFINLIFKIGASKALDVMKILFTFSSVVLIYGLLIEKTKNKIHSLVATGLILLCGSSFFLFDNFTLNQIDLWGEKMKTMNYPLVFDLLGITWVNIPISLAFLVVLERLLKVKTNIKILGFIVFTLLILGFFLISELFASLILMLFFIVFFVYAFRNKVNFYKMFIIFVLTFVLIFIGLVFTEGVAGGILNSNWSRILNLLNLKPISALGYPSNATNSMSIFLGTFHYLSEFFLEIIILILLLFSFIFKKVSFAKNWFLLFVSIFLFIVPMIFSTSFGNINLYKLTHLGIIILYIIFFINFSLNKNKNIFSIISIFFIIGSIPIILVAYSIQWGGYPRAEELRCSQNPQCYSEDLVTILEEFEAKKPGIKYVATGRGDDRQKVADITNSFVVTYFNSKNENVLEGGEIEYVFMTPRLKASMKIKDYEELRDKTEIILGNGEYQVLKIKEHI